MVLCTSTLGFISITYLVAHCATRQGVPGLIFGRVLENLQVTNFFSPHLIVLPSTQHLTEMSTKKLPGGEGVKLQSVGAAEYSTVLVVPNVILSFEAQNSIFLLSPYDLLKEIFTFTHPAV
jgi:hypothetical protein